MNRGIEFFPPDTADDVKRRRWIFLAVWVFAGLMVIWPLFPWLGARQALVFGLPASIVWVTLALAIQFAALLWLYRAEDESESCGGRVGRERLREGSASEGKAAGHQVAGQGRLT